MPKIEINGAAVHYQIHGAGPETIVFAHGLLWSERIFNDQVAALKNRYRCVTFDFRGQGKTEVTRTGYDIETLFSDTVGLIEALGAVPCHFVGVSMGGIIGLRIALRRPELLKSLALFATSADAETDENKRRYDEDGAISQERAKRIHSQISGSKLVVLPRAGHTPTVEEPAAVNGLLGDFLSQGVQS
jgi:pimeloyl-ACP methyl ester carboxylesterase